MAEHAVHELKTWPEFYRAIIEGRKRHELRRNDRDIRVGDTLHLREFDPDTQEYTGASCRVRVTYTTAADSPCALSAFGLKPGFCILSISDAVNSHDALVEALRLARSWVEDTALACGGIYCTPENCQSARAAIDLVEIDAALSLAEGLKHYERTISGEVG